MIRTVSAALLSFLVSTAEARAASAKASVGVSLKAIAGASAVVLTPGESLPFTAEELIWKVARAQRRVDRTLTDYTFDQLEVRTEYGKGGKLKEVRRRVFHYFSGEGENGPTRELVEVDGRPPTEDEKKDVEKEDRKNERRRADRMAEEKAARPPSVSGDDEDPLVGPRRLSDLVGRYDYRLLGEVEREGRLLYGLEFKPRPGLKAKSVGERALGALAGTVLVDAADFQIVAVEARLVAPVKVGAGLAANVKGATISYTGGRIREGLWFPCAIELHLEGKAAVLFRLDTSIRFEFSGFASFSVETESELGQPDADGGP